mgnify:CR=1 FL=1
MKQTVYALDSTTIDLCLSVFPWAPFRSTKAAVKLHTLLDLRGPIPSFVFISDGKLHDVHALPTHRDEREAGQPLESLPREDRERPEHLAALLHAHEQRDATG